MLRQTLSRTRRCEEAERECCVKTKAEIGMIRIYRPRDTKDFQHHQELERGTDQVLPQPSEGTSPTSVLISDF